MKDLYELRIEKEPLSPNFIKKEGQHGKHRVFYNWSPPQTEKKKYPLLCLG
jgi:hypothetical protein